MRFLCVAPLVALVALAMACVGEDPEPKVSSEDAGAPEVPDTGADVGAADASVPADASCPENLTDCSGNGVCDVVLANDPNNCGTCGRQCGAACVKGACLPKEIAAAVDSPQAIAVNSSSVMWVRDDALQSCAKTGCAGQPTLLANNFALYGGGPRKMFATDAHVSWIGRASGAALNEGQLFRCDVTGCPLTQPVAIDYSDRGGQLVANSTTMFWYELLGTVWVRPIDISAARTMNNFAYDESNFTYAVDDTHLVWSNLNSGTDALRGVYACALPCTGPAQRILAAGRHVAVRSGVVYASRDDDLGSPTSSEVIRCAAAGCGGAGTSLTLDKEGLIVDLVADDKSVYWLVRGSLSAPTGAVRACALPDCAGGPRTLASNQAAPIAMSQDDEFVYWANRGTGAAGTGSIQRVRK